MNLKAGKSIEFFSYVIFIGTVTYDTFLKSAKNLWQDKKTFGYSLHLRNQKFLLISQNGWIKKFTDIIFELLLKKGL